MSYLRMCVCVLHYCSELGDISQTANKYDEFSVVCVRSVSYTHLDVYKRQALLQAMCQKGHCLYSCLESGSHDILRISLQTHNEDFGFFCDLHFGTL